MTGKIIIDSVRGDFYVAGKFIMIDVEGNIVFEINTLDKPSYLMQKRRIANLIGIAGGRGIDFIQNILPGKDNRVLGVQFQNGIFLGNPLMYDDTAGESKDITSIGLGYGIEFSLEIDYWSRNGGIIPDRGCCGWSGFRLGGNGRKLNLTKQYEYRQKRGYFHQIVIFQA